MIFTMTYLMKNRLEKNRSFNEFIQSFLLNIASEDIKIIFYFFGINSYFTSIFTLKGLRFAP